MRARTRSTPGARRSPAPPPWGSGSRVARALDDHEPPAGRGDAGDRRRVADPDRVRRASMRSTRVAGGALNLQRTLAVKAITVRTWEARVGLSLPGTCTPGPTRLGRCALQRRRERSELRG